VKKFLIPQKLNIELACDPAIPLLGISPKELKACTFLLCGKTVHNSPNVEIAQYSPVDKQIDKVWHTYL
jgi:hypothetical protein